MMIDLHLILEHQGEVGCGGEHFQIGRGLKGTKQIYKFGNIQVCLGDFGLG